MFQTPLGLVLDPRGKWMLTSKFIIYDFNTCGLLNNHMVELSAQEGLSRGMDDDHVEDKWETKYTGWFPYRSGELTPPMLPSASHLLKGFVDTDTA